MSSYAEGTAWKGDNASVTKPFVTRTAAEFRDAVTQAESITNILKDAYGELTKAKADLETIYDNPPHGLKIAPAGGERYSVRRSPWWRPESTSTTPRRRRNPVTPMW
jgi:hypothetical protein